MIIADPVKGTIHLQVNDSQENPLYRPVYPRTSVEQIKDLDEYLQVKFGKNIHVNQAGQLNIPHLFTDKLSTENGKPIVADVTVSRISYKSNCDINAIPIENYIHSIEPVMYYDNKFRIKTGKEYSKHELGTIFTINNVENAQKDNNGIPINKYINNVIQYEDDKLTFITGEQKFNNAEGKTLTINHVHNADRADNDKLGNDITSTYAKIEHTHNISHIDDLKEFIEKNITDLIHQLVIEGKINIVANTVQMSQYPQYDFEAGDIIEIPLNTNTLYNRPAPEVLKLKSDNNIQTVFTYKFDINAYKYNFKYINNTGRLIVEKNLSFGSPRKLADGYISKSGIITLDDLKSINNITIS